MAYAWYVTSRKAVGHILLHAFGEANQVPASDSYGEGVYLSPVASPHTSPLLSEVPKRYIVWCMNMNRHILPECVVSYKSSNSISGNHGQLKGSTDSKHVPMGTLLSKMKSFLPPNKYHEVGTLFETFKTGKFAKDYLVKQLRSILGDEMLLSTIRKLRGQE